MTEDTEAEAATVTTDASRQQGALAQLSSDIESAVEAGAAFTVTVYGRRRLPASGIIWSDDGLIVTANHVVERDDDLQVTGASGERIPVRLRGRDLHSDLALLAVENAEALKDHAAPRSSRGAKPGTIVLALGRPSDQGIMASFGAVSAVGNSATEGGDDDSSMIRADVAMLPGFSGGPLIDSDGRLLGMNSSHLAGGLTLTHAYIERVVASLAEHGRVRQGYLGIGAQSAQLPAGVAAGGEGPDQERGLLVVAVESGGPADLAGLLLGDVILQVDGTPVADIESLQSLLTGDRVGASASLALLRAGKTEGLDVTVGERSQPSQSQSVRGRRHRGHHAR